MLTPADLAAIRARLDAIPRWTIRPRDIRTCQRIEAGEDALAIARAEVASGHDDWLGWELEPELSEAGRGLKPTQAVQLVDMRADLETLLAEVARLRADGDEMQRAAERAAADENANAVELAAVKAERDALLAEVARLRVSLAATDEGLRAELDRMRAALAAAHREIAEDDEGYAGVDE